MEDKKLEEIIWNKLEKKMAISNFQKEEIKLLKMKILKMVATFVICIGLTVGVVYAGYTVYDNVFKEPKKYESYKDLIEDHSTIQGSQEITKDDKEKTVNEEEAIAEANRILNKFGYENQEFVTKELKKNYIMGAELVYYFTTDTNINKGIHIGINAENGKCVNLSDENLKYTKVNADKITKEEAIKKANEICNLFELGENQYQMKDIKEMPYCFQNVATNQWQVTYCKTYDGAFNYFERVEIAFAVENGKLKLYHVWLANENVQFENNPIEITKEEAQKIALEKDKILTDNQVESVDTKLQIREMNSWIYVLEQNDGKYPELKTEVLEDGSTVSYPEYQVESRIARKVWTVTISYKKGEFDPNNENKYNPKSIFVDVTTGEIVGGADARWD